MLARMIRLPPHAGRSRPATGCAAPCLQPATGPRNKGREMRSRQRRRLAQLPQNRRVDWQIIDRLPTRLDLHEGRADARRDAKGWAEHGVIIP